MKVSKLLSISIVTTMAVVPYAYALDTSTTSPADTTTSTTITTTTAANPNAITTGSPTIVTHNDSLANGNGVANVADGTIENTIKSKISADRGLAKLDTKVSSNQGVVMLEGNTDNHEQNAALTQLAQATQGVKDVDATKLTVKNESASNNTLGYSDGAFADSIITAKVKGLFVREELFGQKETSPMTIQVETKDSNVLLTGTAKDAQTVEKATSLAKSVSGVKDVKSTVTVNGNGHTPATAIGNSHY